MVRGAVMDGNQRGREPEGRARRSDLFIDADEGTRQCTGVCGAAPAEPASRYFFQRVRQANCQRRPRLPMRTHVPERLAMAKEFLGPYEARGTFGHA